jgi:hypothetical protein
MKRLWILCTVALSSFFIVIACNINFQRKVNQREALLSMKTLRDAEAAYKVTKGAGRYGNLKELGAAGLIDSSLASGSKEGYRFEVRVRGDSFEAIAIPIKYLDTGIMSFYLDHTGVIRYRDKEGGEANVNDSPVDNESFP